MDLKNVANEKCKEILEDFISDFTSPAFGALPKREVEILVFQMLQKLELISPNPDIFELVEKLRITRTRASSLVYDSSLRTYDKDHMKELLREVLKKPVIRRDDEKNICFEIENPLLADYLKHEFRITGYAIDGSFSPTLVKLTHEMVVLLVSKYIPEKLQKEAEKSLHTSGLSDKSISGFLTGALKQIGKKVAGEIGGDLVDFCLAALGGKFDEILGSLKEENSK